MTILVAIPAYDGRVCTETMDALLGETALAVAQGRGLDVRVLTGCSSIPSARNALVADFLASDAKRLVFIDSDIAWTPGALMALADLPHAIVGGAYRFKRETEAYVVRWLPDGGELWADEHGCLKVAGLGCGFLAIDRAALEAIRASDPERVYRDGERDIYAYFDMPFADGTMWGEDLRFSHMATRAGVDTFVAPEVELGHVAGPNVVFRGKLGDWLRRRMNDAA